jgi:peptidoglycan/LPS O-acetylase OafA/YrhL
MVAPVQTDERLPELDGFRALSILAVLAGHMLPLGPASLKLNALAATLGMSMFFCLSGFLIAQFLWRRPDFGSFMLRRVARIAPSILLFSVIYIGLVAGRWDSVLIVNAYIVNYVDSAIFPGMSPLWSIAVEMHFYLGIAIAIALFGRRGFWAVPVAAVIVMALRLDNEVFSSIRTHLRVDEILAGSLLALMLLNRDHPVLAQITHWLPRLFIPIVILWLASGHKDFPAMGYLRPYMTAALMGAVLLMQKGWLHRMLSLKTLAYIAAISFALYVWHSPFRVGWWDAGTDVERYLFKRPLAFAITFAIAHVSTFYVETPINRWVRNFDSGRRARTASS